MFVLLPIAGVILEIAREGGRINTAFFILYFISILGFVTMKYGNKKMVECLYKKYSQLKFNRINPNLLLLLNTTDMHYIGDVYLYHNIKILC